MVEFMTKEIRKSRKKKQVFFIKIINLRKWDHAPKKKSGREKQKTQRPFSP